MGVQNVAAADTRETALISAFVRAESRLWAPGNARKLTREDPLRFC